MFKSSRFTEKYIAEKSKEIYNTGSLSEIQKNLCYFKSEVGTYWKLDQLKIILTPEVTEISPPK